MPNKGQNQKYCNNSKPDHSIDMTKYSLSGSPYSNHFHLDEGQTDEFESEQMLAEDESNSSLVGILGSY